MDRFDVIVVGAGHAGIEAALAAARSGCRTACVTMRLDRIGHLPCNCSIGGPAKGHIAREVDALGGQMAVTTDHTLTHLRAVGTGKGPAVRTIRAQVCKSGYPEFMRGVMESQGNLTLIEGAVATVTRRGNTVTGVQLEGGATIASTAVVMTTGTFSNGLCHEGAKQTKAARHGDNAAPPLQQLLGGLDVPVLRFKTGTTPRIRLGSIDLGKTDVMPSEPEAGPLSFLHDRTHEKRDLLPTWQTRTTDATNSLLRNSLDESPMFGGTIVGVGPRYCPSIEDKVVRFADKDSHPIFLEIEEWDSESVYVQGFSTSMPANVQIDALQTIPGLERVELIRPGYAVEYDLLDPLSLTPSLMSKLCAGLFLAGQVNGTSGYEEAAGQGIVAGINAALFAKEEPAEYFSRTESFIGVMVDDLVTKGVEDPYRMLTARAEHRLSLRHDNADLRLTPIAERLGLACDKRKQRLRHKQEAIAGAKDWLAQTHVFEISNDVLARHEVGLVKGKSSFAELLLRPHFDLRIVEALCGELGIDYSALPAPACAPDYGTVEAAARAQVEIDAVYAGYLARQETESANAKALESLAIATGFDYCTVKGLSHESLEKLQRVQPTDIGQASRIPGVRPVDIALLIGHLRQRRGVPGA